MLPIQPPDETPIPLEYLTGVPQTIQDQIADVRAGLDSAIGGITSAATELASDTFRELIDAQRPIDSAIADLDASILKPLNKAEQLLEKAGVEIPVGHTARTIALADQTGEEILRTIPIKFPKEQQLVAKVPVAVNLDVVADDSLIGGNGDAPARLPEPQPVPLPSCDSADVRAQVTQPRERWLPQHEYTVHPVGPCMFDTSGDNWVQPTVIRGSCNVSEQPGVVIVAACVVAGPCLPCAPPAGEDLPTVPPPSEEMPLPSPQPAPGGVVCCPVAAPAAPCPPSTIEVIAPPAVPCVVPPLVWPGSLPIPIPPMPGPLPGPPGGGGEGEEPEPVPPPTAPPPPPEGDGEALPPPPAAEPPPGDRPVKNPCLTYWHEEKTICSDIAACVLRWSHPGGDADTGPVGDFFKKMMPLATRTAGFQITTTMLARLGVAEWAERISGIPFSYMTQYEKYNLQYVNPVYIVDQPTVDELYLKDFIDFGTWTCLTRAHGNIPEWWVHGLNAKQTRVDVGGICELHYRGHLTEEEWEARMRSVGVLDKERGHEFLQVMEDQLNIREIIDLYRRGEIKSKDALYEYAKKVRVRRKATVDELLKVMEWTPGAQDLIRWMKRDVADEEVVKKYRYDEDFKEKYGEDDGAIATWAKAIGLDKEVFKRDWRAHWEILSYTQLLEAYHRFYEGAPNAAVTFLESDFRYALKINDMAPGMVDIAIAMSHRPITNTDARRAYMAGYIDDTDFYHRIRANGYDDKNAKMLTDFQKLDRTRQLSNQTGVMSMRKIMKGYKDGSISRQHAFHYLTEIMPDQQVITDLLDKTDFEQRAETKACSLRNIRKQFMFGYYSTIEMRAHITIIIRDAEKADMVADQWECERESRLKEPRIGQLCKWYTAGLIGPQEYIRRLTNLGYTATDAYNMASVCFRDEVVKRAKAQAAATRQQIKDYMQLQRQTKADMKAEIAEAQKRLKELNKQIEERNKTNEQLGSVPEPSGNGD